MPGGGSKRWPGRKKHINVVDGGPCRECGQLRVSVHGDCKTEERGKEEVMPKRWSGGRKFSRGRKRGLAREWMRSLHGYGSTGNMERGHGSDETIQKRNGGI